MLYNYTLATQKGTFNYTGRTDDPMRILIGTPITNEIEDAALKKFLDSVSKLKYPADLLLVDSSPEFDFVKKVERYCQEYGFTPVNNLLSSEIKNIYATSNTGKNVMIKHINVDQKKSKDEKIGRSREIARKQTLTGYYDAWLNWKCDYLLSPDALYKLVEVMEVGDYSIVSHIPSLNEISSVPTHFFGVDLIRTDVLNRYGFLIDYPDMPSNTWHGNGLWLKKRAVRDGRKCLEINIDNEEHFAKCRSKKQSLKLNLGCAENLLPDYINIDIQEPCDLKHDLREPLPFQDNSIDEIYSDGNTICLFLPKEWYLLKKEIVRVLKPGGKLEILFWDLKYLFRAFLQNKDGERWVQWISLIFSGQVNQYEYSKNGFTYDKLMSDLKEEGVEKFSRKKTDMTGYIHLIGFKKIVIVVFAILVSIPRVIWADLAYLATDLDAEEDTVVTFLTSLSKRKKQYGSSALVLETSQLQP